MKNFIKILNWNVLGLLSCLLLSCGNKGPLYIPDEPSQITQSSFGAQ